jgi:protein tyrosine phosphatase
MEVFMEPTDSSLKRAIEGGEPPSKKHKNKDKIPSPSQGSKEASSISDRHITSTTPFESVFEGDAESCFNKLTEMTNHLGIRVKTYQKARDLFQNVCPSETYGVTYKTTGGKERSINADRVHRKDFLKGTFENTQFIRSQFPSNQFTKKFLSWLLSESGDSNPFILNLLRKNELEEANLKYFSESQVEAFEKEEETQDNLSIDEDEDQDDDDESLSEGDYREDVDPFLAEQVGVQSVKSWKEGGSLIEVSTIGLNNSDPNGVDYDLKITKKNHQKKIMSESRCRMKNFHGWQDNGVVSLDILKSLVDQLLKVKSEGAKPIVVHCKAGQGRTGIVIASAVLKELVESKQITLTETNYQTEVCKLILGLREGGGGAFFVNTTDQLKLLFDFARTLF